MRRIKASFKGVLLPGMLGVLSMLSAGASADYADALRAAEAGESARAAGHPNDPWEAMNRRIFSFNETVDAYSIKPAAKAYRNVVPRFIRRPVGNFFENVRDFRSGVNNILQWRWRDAGHNLGRFGLNTTLGVAGFFDVATSVELSKRDSDFGITLARWGVPEGPYLMLPGLGPSTVRDTPAMYPDYYLSPSRHIDDTVASWTYRGVFVLDVRARVLDFEDAVSGDRYAFLRDFYLQSRRTAAGQRSADDDFEFGQDMDDWDDDDW